jgi:hypothetical protein
MSADLHHEQGNARAASGGTRFGHGRAPARIAGRDQFQIRGNDASVREQPVFLPLTLPVTCRSGLANWRSGTFIRTAGGRCICDQRRADCCTSRLCRPVLSRVGARQSSRAHLRLQTHRIKASLLKPVAEPSHSSTSFRGVTFQRPNRDTFERPKSWKRQPLRTAP